jgi:hypothetical protein
MSKKMKVYNKDGQFLDTVALPPNVKLIHMLTVLNGKGRYIRKQFNKNGTKLRYTYEGFKVVHGFDPVDTKKQPRKGIWK